MGKGVWDGKGREKGGGGREEGRLRHCFGGMDAPAVLNSIP